MHRARLAQCSLLVVALTACSGDSDAPLEERADAALDVRADAAVDAAPGMRADAAVSDASTDAAVALQVPVVVDLREVNVPEGATRAVAVTLGRAPVADVTVEVRPADAGIATASAPELRFTPATWNVAQTLTVTGVQDADVAADRTKIELRGKGLVAASVDVTVADDDRVQVRFSEPSVRAIEGSFHDLTVVLASDPGAEVVLAASSPDPTVFGVNSRGFAFDSTDWNQPQHLRVFGTADDDMAHEATTLILSGAGAEDGVLGVEVTDDDVVPVMVTPMLVFVSEGAQTTMKVHLGRKPPRDVTLRVATDAPALIEVSPKELHFTRANAENDQVVTVKGLVDPDKLATNGRVIFSHPELLDLPITVVVSEP